MKRALIALGLTLILAGSALAQGDPCASPLVMKKSAAISGTARCPYPCVYQLVPASTSPIDICGFAWQSFDPASLVYGQGHNCAGGQTSLTGVAGALGQEWSVDVYPAPMTVLSVPANNGLCFVGGRSNGFLTYAQP